MKPTIIKGLLPLLLILLVPLLACIPQDCLLSSTEVSGKIQSANGSPISDAKVLVKNTGGKGFEAGAVNLELYTDENGVFRQDISVFACDNLIISVEKNGFISFEGRYAAHPSFKTTYESQKEIVITLHKSP